MAKANHSSRDFVEEIMAEPGGEKIMRCFSYGTCTASCPISWVNERYNPRRIIRMVGMGMRGEVLSSSFIWFCSACDICYRHCPLGVKISDLMKAIRNIAIREGFEPPRAIAQANGTARRSAQGRAVLWRSFSSAAIIKNGGVKWNQGEKGHRGLSANWIRSLSMKLPSNPAQRA